MSENNIAPTNISDQKGANQEPQISSDPTELSDHELNKATGGVVVTKRMDAASPGLWTDSVTGSLNTTK